MKILIIIRGENQRYRNGPGQTGYSGLIKATDCVDNWNITLFNDLKNNGIDYDVIFITYLSPILEELVQKVRPIKVITDGPGMQAGHLKTTANLLIQEKGYDRVVILRFDFQYRIRITKWPKWDKTGIILASKDVGWETNKCYHDLVFIADLTHAKQFYDAIHAAMVGEEYHNMIGSYLYHNKIPFELMYDHGYHMINHPLYALKHFDAEPDTDNPDPGIIIKYFNAPKEE